MALGKPALHEWEIPEQAGAGLQEQKACCIPTHSDLTGYINEETGAPLFHLGLTSIT